MPSKSPAQARLMAAAAHTTGGFGGVPQKVGKEFNKADAGTGILGKKPKRTNGSSPKSPAEHMAKRRGQGNTLKQVGSEFGTSKSTAHRRTGNMMRNGYTSGGSAKD